MDSDIGSNGLEPFGVIPERHRPALPADWVSRRELDRLREWWEDGERTRALCFGPGGCGKSALAAAFLRDVLKHQSRPLQPHHIFVHNFAHEPDTNAFFARLESWLGDLTGVQSNATHAIVRFLEYFNHLRRKDVRTLLVLDAVEEILEESEIPQYESQFARLLYRTFGNKNFNVYTIVITRGGWEPKDLHEYLPVGCERLGEDSCVEYMRARGVFGAREDLLYIAERCGWQAETLAIVTEWIVNHRAGSTPFPFELDWAAMEDCEQAGRILQDAREFVKRVAEDSPTVFNALQYLALLGEPVPQLVLDSFYQHVKLEESFAWASFRDRDGSIRLSELLSTDGEGKNSAFAVAPRFRSSLLETMEPREKARRHALIADWMNWAIDKRPGMYTSELRKRILRHLLGAGLSLQAFNYYMHRVGGFDRRKYAQLTYRAGAELASQFGVSTAVTKERLPQSDLQVMMLDEGRYLFHAGYFQEAESVLSELAVEDRHHTPPYNMINFYRARIALLQGRVDEVLKFEPVDEDDAHVLAANLLGLKARAYLVRKDLSGAEKCIEAGAERLERISSWGPLHIYRYSMELLRARVELSCQQRNSIVARSIVEKAFAAYGEANENILKRKQELDLLSFECELAFGEFPDNLKEQLRLQLAPHESMELHLRWLVCMARLLNRIEELPIGSRLRNMYADILDETNHEPTRIIDLIDEGIAICRRNGCSHSMVELLLEKSRYEQRVGNPSEAQSYAYLALYGCWEDDWEEPLDGDFLPDNRVIQQVTEYRPRLLAALHPQFGYLDALKKAEGILGRELG